MPDDLPWGRRLIICCDGTWQSSVSSRENVPSNVTKLCRLISRIGIDRINPEKKWHQIVYYDGGVGTGNLSASERTRQGGTGAGLAENVIEAYNFIVMNYEHGDEIFCFGFSRGAYTARAVAGLVTDIGVIKPLDMQLFPQIYRAYQSNDEGLPFRETQAWKNFTEGKLSEKGHKLKKTRKDKEWGAKERAEGWEINPHIDLAASDDSRKVKVIGVWDTVGSLGVPDVAIFNNSSLRTKYGFHNVKLNENIEHAFHALALDERRKAFRPTLWYIPKDMPAKLAKENKPIPELKQVWFPGVHINIGGGSDDCIQQMEGDLENLATATFVWMLQVISPYLTIDQDGFHASMVQFQRWLDRVRYACTYHHAGWKDWIQQQVPKIPFINTADDSLTPPKRDPPHAHPNFDYGWGVGNIVDSYGGFYRLAGAVPRIPGHCQTEIYDPKQEQNVLVDINEYGKTNEYIHPICAYRNLIRGIGPNSPLYNFDRKFKVNKEGDGIGKGRYWWYHKDDSESIPEWVILRHKDEHVNFERSWYGQCEQTENTVKLLKAAEVKKDWLEDIDEKVDFGVGDKSRHVYP